MNSEIRQSRDRNQTFNRSSTIKFWKFHKNNSQTKDSQHKNTGDYDHTVQPGIMIRITVYRMRIVSLTESVRNVKEYQRFCPSKIISVNIIRFTLCMLSDFMLLLSSAELFSKLTFQNNSFRNTIRVSTDLIQIRTDVPSALIWVKHVMQNMNSIDKKLKSPLACC